MAMWANNLNGTILVGDVDLLKEESPEAEVDCDLIFIFSLNSCFS